MANNIKGITIELGGNVENLNSALKGVSKTAGDLQSELKQVQRQLKFNPGNTELLNQFQSTLPRRERQTYFCFFVDVFIFQSTLPRRERQYWRKTQTSIYDFNPRSRVGSDILQRTLVLCQ